MALAKPRKKKLLIIFIIILSLVQTQVENDNLDSVEERVARLLGQAEFLLNGFDDDPNNWTQAQTDLWNVVDGIDEGSEMVWNYEEIERDLENAIANL